MNSMDYPTKIGILHPGQMGISVAATIQNSGYKVCWASEGRSEKTRLRAEEFKLQDLGTLQAMCKTCELIISICPPHAAEEVAGKVISYSYRGLYLDANAISPEKACRIGDQITGVGATFIDGCIIGGPAWEPGKTWLYLSGGAAPKMMEFFSAGPLETEFIDMEIGKASALKMCYAAYTKGTTALLGAILAVAESLGVREMLENQWSWDWDGFTEQTQSRVRRVTAKAWRFTGEMDEISETFVDAGLPGEFHLAAREIYHRMAGFKDKTGIPELEEVLAALVQQHNENICD